MAASDLDEVIDIHQNSNFYSVLKVVFFFMKSKHADDTCSSYDLYIK